MEKKDMLSRLAAGEVILGDGSYAVTLEKRGYVKAGDWTPEAAPEHPQAVEQLAIEFCRSGADVTQTFTFWCHEDNLPKDCKYTCDEINQTSCDIAKKIAKQYGTITAAGLSQTGNYVDSSSNAKAELDLRRAVEIYIKNDIDVIICEYFRNIEEMEIAIRVAKETDKPVAATMCMAPSGDENNVSVRECAVRMARAGADLVGVNCLFDPNILLDVMSEMKAALDQENLHPYLMVQPLGFRCPDGGNYGWVTVPEFPFACEPRQITRWEAKKFARDAYNLGIRYIGGCCGFEPYHIRAIAEELRDIRGKVPQASDKSDYELVKFKEFESRGIHRYKNKGSESWWKEMEPCTGRPLSTALSRQDNPVTIHKAIFK
ncbi:betaine--homocysteine S-methyltransferase 1 [Eurytemora carolleeae]|uniref:betaine--homocysteine S-methyltransferase 1 n=1 Tax=Eurytemora carolleeae TaxID=1294199 RepID=UPI000C78CAA6|nr:betaine--homocysteine S-methyltransferase 1 [Eurytemora carolleeae]|eukprot:XP_023327628.1 betaine--homocysteine S-methyltransferase 1-like [Eurytemora affinis]